ncbi:MAG: TadE/TadG family type IV pilus assembly protein [Gemmatimonadota bacterium]|nr:TadE/TadG family type IV pilus assembly protein [Gemmatimonadota bacterium]
MRITAVTTCSRRFRRDESGIALLEFALFVSVLLLLVFGIIDFGRALFTANNLVAAAREGARYGARVTNPGAVLGAIRDTAASKMSPFGNAPVNAATQVLVACVPNCSTGQLQSVQVQINYPFTWLTPLPQLMGQPMRDTLHASATFRWEGS